MPVRRLQTKMPSTKARGRQQGARGGPKCALTPCPPTASAHLCGFVDGLGDHTGYLYRTGIPIQRANRAGRCSKVWTGQMTGRWCLCLSCCAVRYAVCVCVCWSSSRAADGSGRKPPSAKESRETAGAGGPGAARPRARPLVFPLTLPYAVAEVAERPLLAFLPIKHAPKRRTGQLY